jgi:hypothetical protein
MIAVPGAHDAAPQNPVCEMALLATVVEPGTIALIW